MLSRSHRLHDFSLVKKMKKEKVKNIIFQQSQITSNSMFSTKKIEIFLLIKFKYCKLRH